jgi:hypothetical protein
MQTHMINMEIQYLEQCKQNNKFWMLTIMTEYAMDSFVFAQGLYVATCAGNLGVVKLICHAIEFDVTTITHPTFFKQSWLPHDERVFEACILDKVVETQNIEIYAWFDLFYTLNLPPLLKYNMKLNKQSA